MDWYSFLFGQPAQQQQGGMTPYPGWRRADNDIIDERGLPVARFLLPQAPPVTHWSLADEQKKAQAAQSPLAKALGIDDISRLTPQSFGTTDDGTVYFNWGK